MCSTVFHVQGVDSGVTIDIRSKPSTNNNYQRLVMLPLALEVVENYQELALGRILDPKNEGFLKTFLVG